MSLLKSESCSTHGLDHEVVTNESGDRQLRATCAILRERQRFLLPRVWQSTISSTLYWPYQATDCPRQSKKPPLASAVSPSTTPNK